ncbi:MAG: HDOD domain-containing protein [Planctomycetia bacterium]|nr:HDOD domain-containing protein [Planctomycetia bacterium]
MKNILFVDDEPKILDALRRMLRPLRSQWHMQFVASGQEALDILAQVPFDVVVSDMRMPGIDGAQLQREVMRRYPQTVRIILSGQSDFDLVLKSVGPAHQFLAKPCDAEQLKSTVARSCALRDRLAEIRLVQIASQICALPSLPSLYAQVVDELHAADASVRKIGDVVARDVAMTAKVLHLINSSFLGNLRPVSDAAQAATLLGLDTIKSLVLSVGIFAEQDVTAIPGLTLDDIVEHSMQVAALARSIAQAEGCSKLVVDLAFTGGALHEVGHLILMAHLGDEWTNAIALARVENLSLSEAEERTIGATHAELGGYLLGLWGLPDQIVEAALFHHTPRAVAAAGFTPLTAVHVADALLRHAETPTAGGELDLEYVRQIGFEQRIDAWTALANERSIGGYQR